MSRNTVRKVLRCGETRFEYRRYVKGWREARAEGVSDVYVPLSFDRGEAFQFDWSHETVVLGGNTTEMKVAHFRLAYSRMFLVIAYRRESQEMLFDAHRRWFEFIGGVTLRALIDNMKCVSYAKRHPHALSRSHAPCGRCSRRSVRACRRCHREGSMVIGATRYAPRRPR